MQHFIPSKKHDEGTNYNRAESQEENSEIVFINPVDNVSWQLSTHTVTLQGTLLEMQHFNEHYKIVFENHPPHPPSFLILNPKFSFVHLVGIRQKSSLLK